jgi:toxin ParE1/3/4
LKLIIAPRAERDLIAIGVWIARDNPERATSFVGEIIADFDRICRSPLIYPEVASGKRLVRQKLHGHYRILFEVHSEQVRVVTVRHSARRK